MNSRKFEVKENGEEARVAADFARSVVEGHRTAARPFTVEYQSSEDGSSTLVVQTPADPKKVAAAKAAADQAKAEADANAKLEADAKGSKSTKG